MPVLHRACCCLKLVTGTTIVGCLTIISGIYDIISSIVQMTQPEIENKPELVGFLTAGICQLIISGLLIRGAMTRNQRLVVPWLIVTIIDFVIINVSVIYEAFVTAETISLIIILLVFVLIIDVIFGYLWAIVYSFYKELEAPNPGYSVV